MNPNDLDATDSIENQGNSISRSFKTPQRALSKHLDSRIKKDLIMTALEKPLSYYTEIMYR